MDGPSSPVLSPLGKFSILPDDIRHLIWKNLLEDRCRDIQSYRQDMSPWSSNGRCSLCLTVMMIRRSALAPRCSSCEPRQGLSANESFSILWASKHIHDEIISILFADETLEPSLEVRNDSPVGDLSVVVPTPWRLYSIFKGSKGRVMQFLKYQC